MKHVCPDCGYESADPGSCPKCGVPLLRRENEINTSEDDSSTEDVDELELDDETQEEWEFYENGN